MSSCLRSHGLQPARLLCPWNFLGKNTGVGCHSLLQGILPAQGSNPGLLHCRQTEPPNKPSQLTNNVVTVSGRQQRDSSIHIYTCPFSHKLPSHSGCQDTLPRSGPSMVSDVMSLCDPFLLNVDRTVTCF